jgi:hypothetical protein
VARVYFISDSAYKTNRGGVQMTSLPVAKSGRHVRDLFFLRARCYRETEVPEQYV